SGKPLSQDRGFLLWEIFVFICNRFSGCVFIAVYPADNLAAKGIGAEIDVLPDITQWSSVNGCLFRTTDYYF
ncbi:hypothetical protein, partial [Pectobacterium odoriferum]|uniref:hypothetical protein n=1 Tax=Pectobacterium odoriferum TaxID=78398 RepID=UPI001CF4CCB3